MNPNLPNIKTYADRIADTENTWNYSEDGGFSYIDTKDIGDENIEYEIVFGNEKIVFIKSGAGGGVRGYENKYLRMAKRIHERMGATVIRASNPDTPHEDADEEEIRWVIDELALSNVEVYFIGTSHGAYQNLSLAKRFPETVKYIGINTSYIDISDLKESLMALSDVSKVMIYGTEDDDLDEVVPAMKEMTCDNLTVKFVKGADHSFSGKVEEFIALADCLYN